MIPDDSASWAAQRETRPLGAIWSRTAPTSLLNRNAMFCGLSQVDHRKGLDVPQS